MNTTEFPLLISLNIEISNGIEWYRGDVHHHSSRLMPGSCILVAILISAIFDKAEEDVRNAHDRG
jgi:hypothetical protein